MSALASPNTSSEPLVVVPWSWDGPSPQDRPIHNPLSQLRDKYFDGGTILSLEFDLYPAYRMIDPTWANRLEAADLTITITMNSRIVYKDIDAVFANRAEIETALARVPADLDLAAADLTNPELRAPLLALFRAFRVPGIQVAKATKVLCLKRPRLIPMLDSLVREMLYDDAMPALPDDPDEFASLLVGEMRLFQRTLLWPTVPGRTNLDGLRLLSDAMCQEARQRMGSPGPVPAFALTPVRLLDNLLWFDNNGFKQFDYVWDEATRRVIKPE